MNGQADLLSLIAEDPVHLNGREAVCEAVRQAALVDGTVDANTTRAHLPKWVQPQVVGATFSWLRSQHVLSPAGWTTNSDRAGKNAGKPLKRWTVNFSALSALSERTNVA